MLCGEAVMQNSLSEGWRTCTVLSIARFSSALNFHLMLALGLLQNLKFMEYNIRNVYSSISINDFL